MRVRYQPQLATLVAQAPDGDEWLHEIKFDGYRIGCVVRAGRATLHSRNGKDWTERFAPVAEAAAALPVKSALLDGEVAVLLPDGKTSFQALQNSLVARGDSPLVYFAFDLHELDGADLRARPLEARKEALRALLRPKPARKGGSLPTVRYSDHVVGQGPRVFAEACRTGLEGIIAKRRSDPHRDGRTTGWLKVKCVARQEMVIAGFTEPEGSRTGIGALLLGVYEGERLVYAGKVGTGFTQAMLVSLRSRLDPLVRKTCPFQPPPETRLVGKRTHWVEPTLVAEVAFIEWTSDGRIRHPSFQGLRADKDPRDVRREEPQREPAKAPGSRRRK